MPHTGNFFSTNGENIFCDNSVRSLSKRAKQQNNDRCVSYDLYSDQHALEIKKFGYVTLTNRASFCLEATFGGLFTFNLKLFGLFLTSSN